MPGPFICRRLTPNGQNSLIHSHDLHDLPVCQSLDSKLRHTRNRFRGRNVLDVPQSCRLCHIYGMMLNARWLTPCKVSVPPSKLVPGAVPTGTVRDEVIAGGRVDMDFA